MLQQVSLEPGGFTLSTLHALVLWHSLNMICCSVGRPVTNIIALRVCSRGMVGWIVLILVAWIFINWTATYFALAKLNFLKR